MEDTTATEHPKTQPARWRQGIAPLFALALCLLAIYALHRELRAYHLRDIRQALQALPSTTLWLAGLLTTLSYAVMTGYDVLALRYVGHPLAYRKTALASFMSYAFSNNLGFGMITGGSARYRLYGAWGVLALDIARIILFCSFTFILGLCTFGSLTLLIFPLEIPVGLHLPFATTRPLGAIFGGAVLAYAGTCLFRRKPLRAWALEFPIPSWRFASVQLLIGAFDWALAGSTLYVLLPHGRELALSHFLTIFILAQVTGIISQVPGGIGVFETVVVLLLSPMIPAPDIVATLLAFRVVYYLVPLVLASVLLGIREFFHKRQNLLNTAFAVGHWTFGTAPSVMALLTFIAGATLLFSGATPDIFWPVHRHPASLPVPLIEISHFAGSIVGVCLLILARGIRQRLDGAYFMTVVMLAAGACFSLVKGLLYQESAVLLMILLLLVSCRNTFTRKASLLSGEITVGWIVSVSAVLFATVWLTFFAYKHIEYSADLWWRFALEDQAPRSLRALVGAACAILAFALGRLLRPAKPQLEPPSPAVMSQVKEIVRQSALPEGNLALLGDKSFLFSESGKAFIMFGIRNRSWITMGDPVGPVEEWPDLLWRFREECHAHAGRPVFYEVGSEHLSLYLDLGMNLLKLGEDAYVPLTTFSLENAAHGSLRSVIRRFEHKGFTFEIVPQEATADILPELRTISDDWLKTKHTREKHFSLGKFDEAYVKNFPVAIVRDNGKIVAFATVWESAAKEDLSADLMRHQSGVPGGLMDFLFTHLMLYGKEQGYQWFNLGMAPLSGLPQHELAPLWNRVGGFLFRYGEHFYNFQGLRNYKAKFIPEWRPRYLASPGGLSLPTVLKDLSTLISSGIGGLVGK